MCLFVFNDIAFATEIAESSRSALAPPLRTAPGEFFFNKQTGKWDVATNHDVIRRWDEETVESFDRGIAVSGKSFRNRWAYMDVSFLIGQMLILTQKHNLQDPRDIFIPLIWKHIRNRDGVSEILLEGFDIDHIEEVKNDKGKITGFVLPVMRNGAPAHRLVYNLQNGETVIQMKDGKNVYVRVDSIQSKEDIETIERTSVAIRSFRHGMKAIFDIFVDLRDIGTGIDSIALRLDEHTKNLMQRLTTIRTKAVGEIVTTISRILEEGGRASREEKLTAGIAEGYIKEMQRLTTVLKTQKQEIEKIRLEFIFAYKGADSEKEKMLRWFEKTESGTDNAVAKLQSRIEIATATTTSYSPQPINDIIADMWGNSKIVMVENYLSKSVEVNENRLSFTSALSNIIINAIHFAKKKEGDNAKVRVVLTEEKGFVRIDVIDNGEGIPKELLEMNTVTGRPRLFNLNISQRKGGTGLGTTEAWYAIKDMGGTISVESELGKGTTFTIRLPIQTTATDPVPINVIGFGKILADIVISEDFPPESLTVEGMVDYIERNRPDLFSDVKSREERIVKVCLGIKSNAEHRRFTEWVSDSLKYRVTIDAKKKMERIDSIDIFNEVYDMLRKMEHIIMPAGSRRAHFIVQPFGYGYENITKLGFDPDSRHISDGRSYFDLCLYPERRQFVGQWERDYAEMISHMSAGELEKEWKRLGCNNRLYALSVKEFIGDTCQKCSPFIFTYMDRNALRDGIEARQENSCVYVIARMAVYLEWASRHWGDNPLPNTVRTIPRKITPRFDYVKDAYPAPQNAGGSVMPFEERPVGKILMNMPDKKAFEILGIQDISQRLVAYERDAANSIGSPIADTTGIQTIYTHNEIYRQESLQKVDEAIELLHQQYPNLDWSLIRFKTKVRYEAARQIEKYGQPIETQHLATQFLERISEEFSHPIFQHVQEPTEEENGMIRDAVDIVRQFFAKHGWEFRDFSDTVEFYSLENESATIARNFSFSNSILVPRGFSRRFTIRGIVHEAFHNLGEGFPIGWLDEGLTDLLSLQACSEYYGTDIQNIPIGVRSDAGSIFEILRPYVERDTQFGPFSSYLIRNALSDQSDEIVFYFPEVALVEYLTNKILPKKGLVLSQVVEAYIKGDMPLLVDKLGKDVVTVIELLDSEKGKDRPRELNIASACFLVEFGSSVLDEIEKYNQSMKGDEKKVEPIVISPESERVHAVNFHDTVTYIQVKKGEKAPEIIAVGKSWLKGYEKGRYYQYDALNPLITSIKSYCEKMGMPFIIGDDNDLPGLIAKEKERRGMPADAKVVMLAGADKDGIISDAIKALTQDKAYTIVGVDGEELTVDSYMRIMEILTIALKLSIGIEPSLENENMTILPPNEKRPFYIVVPHAAPMDYERLKPVYDVQRDA